MNGFLIDTNVLSELRKRGRCDPGVLKWVTSTESDGLFVSAIVLGEIRHGIERIRLRDRTQGRVLENWLERLKDEFADRILPVDIRVAEQWGFLGLRQPVPVLDGLVAATALVHDLTVVSRDETGFRNTGVRLLNPFSGTG